MAKGWDNTISWTSCLSKPTQLPDQVQHELPAKPEEAKLLTAAPPNWISSTSRVDTLPLAAQRKPRILNSQWLS